MPFCSGLLPGLASNDFDSMSLSTFLFDPFLQAVRPSIPTSTTGLDLLRSPHTLPLTLPFPAGSPQVLFYDEYENEGKIKLLRRPAKATIT